MGFIEALVLVLVVLKLCGTITISWMQCFSPFLLYPILFSLFIIIFLIWGFIVSRFK